MTGPKRVQRSRAKGWRMPEGAVYVGRSTAWGNPYRVGVNRDGFIVRSACRLLGRPVPPRPTSGGGQRHTGQGVEPITLSAAEAVYCYRRDVEAIASAALAYLAPLRGRDLVCWCPLDQPCHADVLLELANA